jgi:hypothetical protein
MNARIATIAALALAVACSEPATTQPLPATSPAPVEEPPTPDARRAPVTVTVEGPAHVAAGDSFALTVTIRRAVAGTDAVQLAVTPPEGVRVLEGDPNERIVDPGPAITRKLQLRADQEVAVGQDVVVTATVRGDHYGAHANAAYRFGRPEPRLPQPRGPAVGLTGGAPRK